MNHSNRVFITGRSALTSTGANSDSTWDALTQGTSGIAEIEQWDLSQWACRLGGELKNIQPAKMLPDRKLVKVISQQDVIGINAAVQAVEHSQMISYRDSLSCAASFNEQTAVYVGSPGNKYFQQYDFLSLMAKTQGNMQDFAKQLFDEVHPTWLLRILPNNVLAYAGITYGFKGPNHNITNHAVSGMQALLEAYHAIRSGQAERAVVIAYDMGIEPQAMFYYEQLGVLSHQHLKPFDANHNGTILANGAAALVLESEASVHARSAVCYGEIVGGGCASEAEGLFALADDGQHLANLLSQTLDVNQLQPEDIGMVVAHGNGNVKSDDSEAAAINRVLPQTPVTAFKWSMGHTLTASGLLDAVLTTYALNAQAVPGIANLEQLASNCADLAASTTAQALNAPHALIINRGFASMNACVVIKACD
ncbi:MAG: beta-ketoacyl-[acyl-carrier-protein] synthase family protein [Legionella sp.]